MPIIMRNNCPCEDCKYYTSTDDYIDWCTKKKKSIIQHRGNAYHHAGQWITPCGGDMPLFEKRGCKRSHTRKGSDRMSESTGEDFNGELYDNIWGLSEWGDN